MEHTTRIVVMVLMVNTLWCVSNALSPHGNVHGVLFCSDPGTPTNARREDRLTSFPPGTTVKYYCDFTYRLVGPHNRTCLANGSWSDVQPSCQKYMCDELDVLPPKKGKRIGEDFTIGSKLKFKCSSLYTLIGADEVTCLPDGQWSARTPKCEHRCEQLSCGVGMICKIRNLFPTCVCRTNMECSSNWDPVCGSDGISYNNDCIMKATACRMGRNIRTVAHDKCLPGDRCSIFPISKCRAAFDVYFYNVTAGECQHMIAGGCHPSGWNGFFLENDCQSYCNRDTCLLKPDSGPCDHEIRRWYFDAQTKSCKTFEYGGCFGNSNNFRTMNDCKKRCV